MIRKASKSPAPPVVLCGHVARTRVRHGTGSEHIAVVLRTDEGEELILQRIGANPFEDPEGEKLVGHRVTVEGYRLGNVFRYRSAR
ncbi:MAG: hypothetical protein IT179_11170 [Acidobacteria bacterium]|nr:hypothetical protein [Acidobacteriota bacterium]